MPLSRATRSQALNNILAVVFVAGGLLAGVGTLSSKEDKPWKVDGRIFGEPKKLGVLKDADDAKRSKDVSGLACTATDFPRLCLIVDDETQGAQVVILKDDKLEAGDFIALISDAFDNEPVELDAEGVAYAGRSFYVMGSHGRPRHAENATDKDKAKNAARVKAAGRVFRIDFEPDSIDMKTGKIKAGPKITGSSKLNDLIDAQADLAQWVNKDLDEGGLTVEGVAVRNGRLYAGLRGPVLPDSNAVILEAPLAAVFDGQQGSGKLHRLALGKDTQDNERGIRDLIPFGNGLLVLAGPMKDPEDENYEIKEGDYTVFYWDETRLAKLQDLDGYGVKMKPEAIVPLEEKDRKLYALILFDGGEEGMPTPVTIDSKQGG